MNADSYAQEASVRYNDLCVRLGACLASSVHASIASGVFKTPATSLRLIANQYLAGEAERIRELTENVESVVQREVSEYYGSKSEIVSATQPVAIDTLQVAVVTQVESVLTSAMTNFRQFQINALNVAKTGVDLKKAMSESAARVETVNGSHTDRRGKSWKGDVYIRTVWRQAYVWSEAQATMSAIADHKKSLAVIVHPEDGHKSNGIIVSVSGNEGYPTWEAVRDKHFHPNTRARLKPYGE